jgi:hypothetical protein
MIFEVRGKSKRKSRLIKPNLQEEAIKRSVLKVSI